MCVSVCLGVLVSQGRGTTLDPSKSDQEEYLSSSLLTFDGSGSQWGEGRWRGGAQSFLCDAHIHFVGTNLIVSDK